LYSLFPYGLNFWRPWNPGGSGYGNYDLFLADNGKVGIGTNNPLARLDVNGSFKAQSAEITGTLSANTLNAKNINFGDTVSFKTLKAQTVQVSGNSFFNGNVGIGVEIPAKKLDVNGSFRAQSADISGYVTTTNLYTTNADVDDRITTKRLYATNTEVSGYVNTKDLYVTAGAKVYGLLKAQKMRIEETLCAKEIKVTNPSCTPDYVFAKDYPLMPLNEVEQFITENQHLPRVPSAAEVAVNGINLGEMNNILLEKVEELTLYIIQLEKRLLEVEKKKGGE